MIRRAVQVAQSRRERNNSNQSDEMSLKRHRSDNGILGNNNSPDVANNMSQITATDFSTNAKYANNNNNTPPLKDERERERGLERERERERERDRERERERERERNDIGNNKFFVIFNDFFFLIYAFSISRQ